MKIDEDKSNKEIKLINQTHAAAQVYVVLMTFFKA